MPSPTSPVRSVLTVIALVSILASTVLVYAQDRLFDADDFAATVAASLSEPDVNAYVSDQVVDALVDRVPDLAIAVPILNDITSTLLRSGVAASLVDTAAANGHRAAFSGGEGTFLLDLSDMVVLIADQLAVLAPTAADKLPDSLSSIGSLAVELSSGEAFTGLIDAARTIRRVTVLTAVVGAFALVALAVRERDPWHGLQTMGIVISVAGLGVVVVEALGDGVLAAYGSTESERDALAGLWHVVFGDLQAWGWVLVGTGAVLAGSAWAIRFAGSTAAASRDLLTSAVQVPDSRWGRSWRAMGLLLVAFWAITSPDSFVAAAVRLLGMLAAMTGAALLARGLGLDRAAARFTTRAEAAAGRSSAVTLLGRAVVPAALVVVLAAIGAALLTPGDSPALTVAGEGNDGCNGAVELCDRRLDEVAMAASHNAMSSTDTAFYLPNQTNTILEQLDDGIRGLMLDTWYGRQSPNGIVVTTRRTEAAVGLDATTAAAVEAARSRAGADLGPAEVYMCHSFCEIGAVDAVAALADIRMWLAAHPREVLVIIVQDATDPVDTAAAFVDAGLEPFALRQEFGQPFPTLGEMIESGQRLFVMAEHDPGDIDWFHDAFVFSQETPYSFGSADEFNCDENRGRPDSPLFVVNHFITPAFGSNHVVNARDVVHARVEKCRAERGMLPNLIAGDFVERGDLVEVAAELNGLGDDS